MSLLINYVLILFLVLTKQFCGIKIQKFSSASIVQAVHISAPKLRDIVYCGKTGGDFAISGEKEILSVLTKEVWHHGVATTLLKHSVSTDRKLLARIYKENKISPRCFQNADFEIEKTVCEAEKKL